MNSFQRLRLFSGEVVEAISESMSTISCGESSTSSSSSDCRDEAAALSLKMIAIVAILISGVAGVAIPLVAKRRRFLRAEEGSVFVAAKAFAAGVILATGFVHMLPGGTAALSDPCLPKTPWSKFPFPGFTAMIASLATLLVDFVGTQFYERRQKKTTTSAPSDGDLRRGLLDTTPEDENENENENSHEIAVDEKPVIGEVFGEEKGGGMHIVGIHAHAAHHRHRHDQDACDGGGGHGHGHSHELHFDDTGGNGRHVIVSQILELGIVSHSVIIGLSLGVSQSPCSIRPLIAALSFHQFFEGFALGGCIAQAQFRWRLAFMMACFFATTTPVGIAVGSGLAWLYNPKSPRALVVEGILDCVSAGILVYMALVDLIAADFLSKKMRCNVRLQVVSYFTLFLGAASMSFLAIWA
ncbi:hypothetical protein Sjap_019814 [Stephania japonica]|uniref:Uncharacterized protein n=1 Tax=Stephania japonica TaxID=461633 RepID=A0AAP0F274_9MAGN